MNLQPHHLESVGWTLIHFCWQAASIALVYKITETALTRRAAKTTSHLRYVLALVALLSMFAAAAGTFVYEEFRLQRSNAIAQATSTVTNKLDISSAVSTPFDSATSSLASGFTHALPRAETLLPWIDGVWMLGVFVLSLRTIGGWLLLQRLRASASAQLPPELAASFTELARRLGVHGRVALRLSTRVASPIAVGMVRSLILLPASALTTLTPEQLEAVLAHELAHIRRADYLWNILQTMIETLFFFHPAVWYVGYSLRQQRELCCDDIAIACCHDPVTYATALLALEEQRAQLLALHTPGTGLPLALALDGHQSRFTLLSRIARILGEPMEPSTSPRALAPFSILGVCAALALFAVPVPQVLAVLRPSPVTAPAAPFPQATPAEPAMPTALAVAPVRPYQATLADPVVPIAKLPPAPANPAMPQAPAPAVIVAPAAPAPAPVPAVVAAPAPLPRASILGVEILRAITLAANAHVDMPQNLGMKFVLDQASQAAVTAANTASLASPSPDYITQMRAAGYSEDVDQYMAMKIHGITPEYARSMAQAGFGKPDAGQLLALKIHGVTPDYVNQLKAAGIKPESFQDVVSYRIFNVTPEFVAGMKSAGFGDLAARKLVELRIQNVTPEFARTTKQQFPEVTLNQLVQLRIFHIDDAFIAKAKSLGITPITIPKLVQLRTSGLIEDTASNRSHEDRDRARDQAREERERQREVAQAEREQQREKAREERDREQDKATNQ